MKKKYICRTCAHEQYTDRSCVHCSGSMLLIEHPPLGIIDRQIDLDRFNMERLKKLYEAITRYIMAEQEVPEEWTNEFNEIVRNFNNRGK